MTMKILSYKDTASPWIGFFFLSQGHKILEPEETLANLVQPFDLMTKIFPCTLGRVQSVCWFPYQQYVKNSICCHEQVHFKQTELFC